MSLFNEINKNSLCNYLPEVFIHDYLGILKLFKVTMSRSIIRFP